MKPVISAKTQHALGAPLNWDEKAAGVCGSLPIQRGESSGVHWVSSYWQATWMDRLRILFGRPIRLTVVGRTHPPVMVDTEE